ncbi:MAG TPA: carboxypeptidase regulatory-like domain-containing protein [Dongiaceae bacterium]|nr:carboxypeptidase regulatory-like domain-containing protein [Dongiaceae bacterium]
MIGLRLRAIVLLLVGACLIFPYGADAQCTPEPTTIVKGTVFLEAPDKPDYVQGAEVIVQGDTLILSAVTGREGMFSFSNIEPGTYTVEATYFGLHAEQKITIESGTVVQVALQLTLLGPKAPRKP